MNSNDFQEDDLSEKDGGVQDSKWRSHSLVGKPPFMSPDRQQYDTSLDESLSNNPITV